MSAPRPTELRELEARLRALEESTATGPSLARDLERLRADERRVLDGLQRLGVDPGAAGGEVPRSAQPLLAELDGVRRGLQQTESRAGAARQTEREVEALRTRIRDLGGEGEGRRSEQAPAKRSVLFVPMLLLGITALAFWFWPRPVGAFDIGAFEGRVGMVCAVAKSQGVQGTEYLRIGHGTGFCLQEPGYVVTNRHVAAMSKDPDVQNFLALSAPPGTAVEFVVAFSAKEVYPATVVYESPTSDIALLKIDKSDWRPLPSAPIGETKQGDTVYVVGFPGAAAQLFTMAAPDLDAGWTSSVTALFQKNAADLGLKVTRGVVSAIYREPSGQFTEGRVVQTDAAINHGNSGGPMVDEQLRVIGVNTFGAPPGQASGTDFALVLEDLQGQLEAAASNDKRNK